MKLQIESLSILGFGHLYIASWVFAKQVVRVHEDERDSVTAYITARGLHVTNWRNGLNPMATSFAETAVEDAKNRFSALPK